MTAVTLRTAFAAAALGLFLAAGCAEKGPLLLDGVAYQVPEGAAAAAPRQTVVALGTITDMRGKAPSVIGSRTIRDYVENDLVVQGTVASLVSDALKGSLAAKGIAVKDAAGADLVLSGEIKTLWVDVLSQPLNVRMKAEVQLRMTLSEGAGRTPVRTVSISSNVEREAVAFSLDRVAATLSEALTSSLDQLLRDEELKKRIN